MDQMWSFEATSQTCQYYFGQIQNFEIWTSGLFPVFNETTVNFRLISGVDFQTYNFQVLIWREVARAYKRNCHFYDLWFSGRLLSKLNF